jgi:RHS repeat-associated protein
MRTAAGSYYYLLDGLGSVAALTDSSGTVVASYSYEPFGTLKSSTGTLSNPYRWLGALGVYFDTATGLYKMGTRYYDPALGRFTQVDPIAGASHNPYDYAGQDPINLTDPDGLWPGEKKWKKLKKVAKQTKKVVDRVNDKAAEVDQQIKDTAREIYRGTPRPLRRCIGGGILLGAAGAAVAGPKGALVGAGVGCILGGIRRL